MENLFSTRLQQLMYPGTTYSQVSGGDPREITNLKYEELVEFHRSYYNPSNAYFMTYGDYPIEKHLKYLDGRLTQGNVEIKSTPSFIPTENGIKRKVISGISDSCNI
jgi:Zn-dependent M16 (insulinase) family peptidase